MLPSDNVARSVSFAVDHSYTATERRRYISQKRLQKLSENQVRKTNIPETKAHATDEFGLFVGKHDRVRTYSRRIGLLLSANITTYVAL